MVSPANSPPNDVIQNGNGVSIRRISQLLGVSLLDSYEECDK